MTGVERAGAARVEWQLSNPYPFYEERRREGDVVWDETLQQWLVLGYDAARYILGGSGWTSTLNPDANPAIAPHLAPSLDPSFLGRFMMFADGANHARLRGSVREVFTPSFVTGLLPGIEAIASAVIERPATRTVFDFMEEIASPLPVAVIGEWLDLDLESARRLRDESPILMRMLSVGVNVGDVADGMGAFAALVRDFLPLAAERRTHPGDDLLSLIASNPDFELDDVIVTAVFIAIAGHETTANLLGTAVIRLLTVGPDGTRLIDSINPVDPSLINEIVRLDTSVQGAGRRATKHHVIDGVHIAPGDQTLVVVAAANRDPSVFDDPSQFRVGRAGPAPLSFGYGAHYCIGATLARLELGVALRGIAARRPSLAGSPTWREAGPVRGPLTIPVVFDRA